MSKEKTQAAILLATYNGEKFITSQLESILRQTYKPLKVIIRDDRSTDKTATLVRSFIKEHNLESNWNFQINAQNKGWRLNFIEMLCMIDTGYVFYADQDDVWNENKVSVMVQLLNTHHQINVLVSDYTLFGEPGGEEKIKRIDEIVVEPGLYQVKQTLDNLGIRRDGCAFAIRSTFIPNIMSGYREVSKDSNGFPQAHDLATWLAGVLSNSLYHVHEDLINHRIHSASTWSMESKKIKKSKNTISQDFINFYYAILQCSALKDENVYHQLLSNKIKDFEIESELLKSGSNLQKLTSFHKFSSIKRYLGFVKRNIL